MSKLAGHVWRGSRSLCSMARAHGTPPLTTPDEVTCKRCQLSLARRARLRAEARAKEPLKVASLSLGTRPLFLVEVGPGQYAATTAHLLHALDVTEEHVRALNKRHAFQPVHLSAWPYAERVRAHAQQLGLCTTRDNVLLWPLSECVRVAFRLYSEPARTLQQELIDHAAQLLVFEPQHKDQIP